MTIFKSLVLIISCLALFLAPTTALGGELVATRIMITRPDGTQMLIEIAIQRDEEEDPARLNQLSDELKDCQKTYRDCQRASSEEVLRSPGLYGTYVGMLAGAFVAGFCAVRPEECTKPLER